MEKQYAGPSGQDMISVFQFPRKPAAMSDRRYGTPDYESPYLQPVFETGTFNIEQAAREWGSKAAVAQHLERLTYAAMPQLAGKKAAAMKPQERTALKKMWVSIREQMIEKRRQLITGGWIPPLGGAPVPFGFRLAKYGSYSGLAADTTYLKSPRLDTTLAALQQQGKISITRDQLDIFQRISNLETGGRIQTLNTYDSAVVSIGFFQFTLHVGKIQAWIKLAPDAFRKYGIELDTALTYKFGNNGTHPAIKGLPDSKRNDLRWNGWAERFYYAGLDADVIAAEVKLGLYYLGKHLGDLKARLKNKPVYETFLRFYNTDAYVRGLFQASHNNNPARSTRCVKAAIAKAGSADLQGFLEQYKNIMITSGWERLVSVTSKGTTIELKQEKELYEDYIMADLPEMLQETETYYPEETAYEEEADFPDDDTAATSYENRWDHPGLSGYEIFGDDEETGSDDDEYEMTDYEEEPDRMDDADETGDYEGGPEFMNDNGNETTGYGEGPVAGWDDETIDFEEESDFSGSIDAETIAYEEADDLEAATGHPSGTGRFFLTDPTENESAQTPGITRYLAVSAVPGLSYNTGAFLPPSFTPAAEVDVVLFLHGLYPANNIGKYWTEYTPLRKLFTSSNRNALLLVPQLGADPQNRKNNPSKLVFYQRGGLDRFMQECFRALISGGQIPAGAAPRRIIVAAHSAGGNPLCGIMLGANALLPKITECWGFDCLYNYSYDAWLTANRHIRFYHYWATPSKNVKTIPPRDQAGALRKKHPNLFNIGPKKAVNHQHIIAYAWENEINKRPWFTAATVISTPSVPASRPLTTIDALAGIPFLPENSALDLAFKNGIHDKNQLTNLIFFKRYPAYRGRSLTAADPQRLKTAWSDILRTVVSPFLQRQNRPAAGKAPVQPAPAPGLPAVPDGQFVLETLPLLDTPITITIKDKKNDSRRSARLTEKPSVFLKAVVQKGGLDVDKFFSSMTRIKFLGRSFKKGQAVHIDFARLLKKIEAEFVRKAGGKVTDMKALGDGLGLSDEDLAASRGASPTADLSWHMFGLALDVDYTNNPFFDAPVFTNKLMLKIGYLVTNKKISQIPVSGGYWSVDKTPDGYMVFYDKLVEYNNYFKEYFNYLDDPATLGRKLASASYAPWKGKTPASAHAMIKEDLGDLVRIFMEKRPNAEMILKKTGFFAHSREFVYGMVSAGLNWGAWYGDMMHFDMRSTPIGGKISQGKSIYQTEKLDEMGIKFGKTP